MDRSARKKLILQPHEVRDFNYEISVPSNAISGGHYLSMLFLALPLTQRREFKRAEFLFT